MKKFLTAFIFIFWFVSIASAGELITGAFCPNPYITPQKNFMQYLIHRENFDTLDESNKFYGSKTAQVRPLNPNQLFDSYRVWFTPTNKIVVGISGFGEIQSCGSESRGLKGILDKKYGNNWKVIVKKIQVKNTINIHGNDWKQKVINRMKGS